VERIMNPTTLSRRQAIGAATAAMAIPAQLFAQPSRDRSGNLLAFDNPLENVRTMARLTSTLEPGKTGFVRYQGKAFGLLEDGRNVPFYNIDGIGALRALPQADGAIRFLFNEFALYLDPKTGVPLTQWTNPITNRTVDVWHQRNGPVNYEISPTKSMFGSFARTDGTAGEGFQLPWVMRGPFATFALDVVSSRKNALVPSEWPLESSGEMLPSTEHSQYSVLRRDIENKKLLSVPFFAALQSMKPWHPWMLMGQRPGRVFTRMVAQKVSGPEVLDSASLAYARTHLSEWMEAPASWTGEYVTAQAIYKATRKPLN
jgi:Protein of unknown function (DUF1838)